MRIFYTGKYDVVNDGSDAITDGKGVLNAWFWMGVLGEVRGGYF